MRARSIVFMAAALVGSAGSAWQAEPISPAGAPPGEEPAAVVAGPTAGVAARPTAVGAVGLAQDGLTQEVSTSYEVRPTEPATRVVVTATLTHTKPDDGSTYYFWDTYWIAVPSEAANVSARVGGAAVTPSVDRDGMVEGFSRVSVPLDPPLRYGQTRTVTISYALGPQADRADALSQANEAFFMFPVLVSGDPGRAGVEVRIPSGYEVTVLGDELEQQDRGDEVVLSANPVAEPHLFASTVLAMDESRLVGETRETAAGPIELRAWPGDTEWIEFVTGHVDEGVPVLSELVGQPWPNEEPLTITETMTPVAHGYGGWYEPAEHTIMIGNELDGHLVLHELSHVWFSFDLFEDRWVLEGLAEEYAFRALEEMGRPPDEPRPDRREVADRLVPLSEWSAPTISDGDTDHDIESYGYTASWYVVAVLVDEVGIEAMQDVIAVATEGTITYRGNPDPEPLEGSADWRRLLDLIENFGGSEEAADLFGTYVLTPTQRDEVARREVARDAYAALAEESGEWSPPYAVRRDMAEWRFDEAVDGMVAAGEVLRFRDKIDVTLAGSDVASVGLADQYESAVDVGELVPVAERTLEAADAYRELVGDDRGSGLLARVGLLGRGVDGRIAAARAALEAGDPDRALALTRSASGRLDDAARVGAFRLAGSTLVVGVAAAIPVYVRRRHRRGGTIVSTP